jgi:uncharacterized protein YjiS (DUF1127 family)
LISGFAERIKIMSAPIAKNQLAFELPRQSYVDVSLEEPELHEAVQGEGRHGVAAWIAERIHALAEWNRWQRDLAELRMMTDHELADIGLNRGDLPRVFQPGFNQDLLVARGYDR